MLERWMQAVWLGKRFTTDEHKIGLENGQVVRSRPVGPKSLEDTWNMDELDKMKGHFDVMRKWTRKDFAGSKIQRQLKKST